MSSLALPLDSGESSQSLLSRRQSEVGSSYVVESGVFMSSLSATIFIVALVSIGVLMLTLLIALTVMLESCKRSGSGVFDDVKKSDHHDHCNLFIFHAELNNLAASEIPIICKLHTFQFIKERYLRDLNTSLWFVEEYFSTLKPDKDGLDAILLDADDILSSTENLSSISSLEWIKQFEDMNHQAHVLIVRLLVQLQASNWSFILFSRKPAKLFNTTWRTLIFSGYTGWSSLIMRIMLSLLGLFGLGSKPDPSTIGFIRSPIDLAKEVTPVHDSESKIDSHPRELDTTRAGPTHSYSRSTATTSSTGCCAWGGSKVATASGDTLEESGWGRTTVARDQRGCHA